MGTDNLFFKRARIMKASIEADLQSEIDDLDETVRSVAKRYIRILNKGVTLEAAELFNWDLYEEYAIDLLMNAEPVIPTFKEYSGVYELRNLPLKEPDTRNLLLMVQALYINGDMERTVVIGNPLHNQDGVADACKDVFGWETELDMANGIMQIMQEKGEMFW